jgi:hypothetical membrane protein
MQLNILISLFQISLIPLLLIGCYSYMKKKYKVAAILFTILIIIMIVLMVIPRVVPKVS